MHSSFKAAVAKTQESERSWDMEMATGLSDDERDQVERMNTFSDLDLPEMAAWPNWRNKYGLRVIGICPFCGETHTHGIGVSTKLSGCQDRPRAHYRLVVRDEPMPDDLRFLIDHEPPNLAFFANLIEGYAPKIQCIDSASAGLRRRKLKYSVLKASLAALWACGVFAEREAIAVIDQEANPTAVRRSMVAAFVREQKGPTTRSRIAQALRAARLMVAGGKLL